MKKIVNLQEYKLDSNDNIIEHIDITPYVESYSIFMEDGKDLQRVFNNMYNKMIELENRVRELEIKLEIQEEKDQEKSLKEDKEVVIEKDVEDEVVK